MTALAELLDKHGPMGLLVLCLGSACIALWRWTRPVREALAATAAALLGVKSAIQSNGEKIEALTAEVRELRALLTQQALAQARKEASREVAS